YRYPMIMITLGQIGIFLTFPILPYFLEQLGAPPKILSSITGLAIGLSSIFNIVFAPIWGRWSDKYSVVKLLKSSSLILTITFFLHSISISYFLVLALRALVGLSIAGLVPILYSHLGKIGDTEKIGVIMGFASSATLFGSLVAFLGSALISPLMSMNWLFVLSAGILSITFFLSKRIQQGSEK
ncbi:MAG: MFS transporter, partial [Candidatus Kapaibacteriota bacterium]